MHDCVLEGLCKAVDVIHVFLVVRIGGGKTGIFYGYVLLLRALKELVSVPSPQAKVSGKSCDGCLFIQLRVSSKRW